MKRFLRRKAARQSAPYRSHKDWEFVPPLDALVGSMPLTLSADRFSEVAAVRDSTVLAPLEHDYAMDAPHGVVKGLATSVPEQSNRSLEVVQRTPGRRSRAPSHDSVDLGTSDSATGDRAPYAPLRSAPSEPDAPTAFPVAWPTSPIGSSPALFEVDDPGGSPITEAGHLSVPTAAPLVVAPTAAAPVAAPTATPPVVAPPSKPTPRAIEHPDPPSASRQSSERSVDSIDRRRLGLMPPLQGSQRNAIQRREQQPEPLRRSSDRAVDQAMSDNVTFPDVSPRHAVAGIDLSTRRDVAGIGVVPHRDVGASEPRGSSLLVSDVPGTSATDRVRPTLLHAPSTIRRSVDSAPAAHPDGVIRSGDFRGSRSTGSTLPRREQRDGPAPSGSTGLMSRPLLGMQRESDLRRRPIESTSAPAPLETGPTSFSDSAALQLPGPAAVEPRPDREGPAIGLFARTSVPVARRHPGAERSSPAMVVRRQPSVARQAIVSTSGSEAQTSGAIAPSAPRATDHIDTRASTESEVSGGPRPIAGPQQQATSAPTTSSASSGDIAPTAADLDELAHRLYDRIRFRLRSELRLDRERTGMLTEQF